MRVRPIGGDDRLAIAALLRETAEFSPDDVTVALELVDHAIHETDDYRALVACDEREAVVGYVCFGPTPMTDGTFDLYWIASARNARRSGVGRALVRALHETLTARGARLIRVETSSRDDYAGTRAFYEGVGYREVARIADFYSEGDDLVVYGRYLR